VEPDVALSFQAPFDPKLLQPGLRRLLRPVVVAVCAGLFLIAVLFFLAGERSLAVWLAVGSILGALLLPWYLASEAIKRNVDRAGQMHAYRIDRTGIQTSGGFSTITLSWAEVTRLEQRRDQVLVYSGRRSVQAVPTGTLTTDERALLQRLLPSRENKVASPAGSS